MRQSVTPKAAIQRAFVMVTLPSMVCLIIPIAASIAAIHEGYIRRDDPLVQLLSFAASFGGAWLAWSIQTPKWRLWAYERVDDIGELKALAVRSMLIWPEGSFLGRTEIMSRDTRARLHSLEKAKAPNRKVD